MTDFGLQYRLDDSFKRRARLQQSTFRATALGLPGWEHTYGRAPTPTGLVVPTRNMAARSAQETPKQLHDDPFCRRSARR